MVSVTDPATRVEKTPPIIFQKIIWLLRKMYEEYRYSVILFCPLGENETLQSTYRTPTIMIQD
jgi:hypothetical protein